MLWWIEEVGDRGYNLCPRKPQKKTIATNWGEKEEEKERLMLFSC